MYGHYNGLFGYHRQQAQHQQSQPQYHKHHSKEIVDDIIEIHERSHDQNLNVNNKEHKTSTVGQTYSSSSSVASHFKSNSSNKIETMMPNATTLYRHILKKMESPRNSNNNSVPKNFTFSTSNTPQLAVPYHSLPSSTELEPYEKYEKLNYKQKLAKKLNENLKFNPLAIPLTPKSDDPNEQVNLLKYELKEKDLDIVQLQKEIHELQLENRIIKAKMPIHFNNSEQYGNDSYSVGQNDAKEVQLLKKENECLVDELHKLQDIISHMKLEKSVKSIELYDPNNPEFLQKKIRAYEKQVQDLEDENEKFINELSLAEKYIEKIKDENEELKTKLSKSLKAREEDETLLQELNHTKNEIRKLKHLNQQLLDENKRLITNTITVNNKILNEMYSKDAVQSSYEREHKINSQKRQEEVFADEIRNLRKEISNLSAKNRGQRQTEKDVQIEAKREKTRQKAYSDEDSESTQYLTAYKTVLTTSKPQVTSFTAKYLAPYEPQQQPQQQKQQGSSEHTKLVRSSSITSNLSQSSDSTIRITTKISRQNQDGGNQLPVQIKSLDEYLINNFRPFHNQVKGSATSSTSTTRPPIGFESLATNMSNGEYVNSLRLNLQNDVDSESSPYKSEKHFTDYEFDGEEAQGKYSQGRSRSADLMVSRRDKFNERREKESSNSDLIRDIMARKRPFVPLRPEDINIDDVIKFSRPSGKITKGIVKYIGPLPDRSDIYLGLELDAEEGKHDGVYQSKRYFQTKQNKGVFVSFSKVVMAWGNNN